MAEKVMKQFSKWYLLLYIFLATVQSLVHISARGFSWDLIAVVGIHLSAIVVLTIFLRRPLVIPRIFSDSFAVLYMYIMFSGSLSLAKTNLPIFLGMVVIYFPMALLIVTLPRSKTIDGSGATEPSSSEGIGSGPER